MIFVFIINWEGWFFGIRIAGLYAGIYLLARGLISLLLGVFFICYPKKTAVAGALSVLFFGYMFLDSAVTSSVFHPGTDLIFPVNMGILVIIGYLYLMVRTIQEYLDVEAKKSDNIA